MLLADLIRHGEDIDDDASPLALEYPMPFYGQVVQDKLQTWLDIPVLANQQNIKNPALLVLEELYIYIRLEFGV